jgi:hypothetical protein
MGLRYPKEGQWTRKKRSEWMLRRIDTFLIQTRILFSLIILQFRENITDI